MKFYINKYPIVKCQNFNGKENEVLPAGLAFTIDGIVRDSHVLSPVKKIQYEKNEAIAILDFTPEILVSAFTEVDYLPE